MSKAPKSPGRPKRFCGILNIEEASWETLSDLAEMLSAGCGMAHTELLEAALLHARGQNTPRFEELQGYAKLAHDRRAKKLGA